MERTETKYNRKRKEDTFRYSGLNIPSLHSISITTFFPVRKSKLFHGSLSLWKFAARILKCFLKLVTRICSEHFNVHFIFYCILKYLLNFSRSEKYHSLHSVAQDFGALSWMENRRYFYVIHKDKVSRECNKLTWGRLWRNERKYDASKNCLLRSSAVTIDKGRTKAK